MNAKDIQSSSGAVLVEEQQKESILLAIEDEIKPMLEDDKKSWVRVYRLMERVENEQLFKGKYRSFTSWMNHLSVKCNINVSLLWKRKKAGKFYSDYFTTMTDIIGDSDTTDNANVTITTLENIKIAPESLNLIEKISCGNMNEAHKLIVKVQKEGLTRADLNNTWQNVKATRKANNQSIVRTNSHDKVSYSQCTGDSKSNTGSNVSMNVSAKDIILALTNSNWLPLSNTTANAYDYGNSYCNCKCKCKYKLITEFPVQSGDNRHAKRIDALILENYSVSKHNHADIYIHAVEVKVSKHDLLSDHKMSEYAVFSDFFWLAVPSELKDIALEYMPLDCGCGLLLYTSTATADEQQQHHQSQIKPSKPKLKIEVLATKNSGFKRMETLSTAVLKLI